MACKDAYKIETKNMEVVTDSMQSTNEEENTLSVRRLLFGVDSKVQANDVLQNNLTEFEWVTRNKLYPNFWGRNITGKEKLTKDEIAFLHKKGCKIAATYNTEEPKETEEQGRVEAKKIAVSTLELNIPEGTAIFLEIGENEKVTSDYMKGYAEGLLFEGYTPGFKANADAMFEFDHAYSRGMQTDKAVFEKCLIWAVSPSLAEYDRVTTTHLIHPDHWGPFAPSGTTRNDIAIWQYGKDCHPIHDDAGNATSFNINLVRNDKIIIEKMF